MPAKKKNQATTRSVFDEVDVGSVPLDKNITSDMWWLLLIRGIALVLFGTAAVIWPGITLVSLAFLFTIYLFVSGFVDIVVGIRTVRTSNLWFLRLALGLLELGFGVYIIHRGTLLAVATLVVLIGLAFVFQGIVEIVSAFKTSRDAGSKLWPILGGLLALVAGVIILRHPVAGGLTFTWVLGLYGLVVGAITVAASLAIRPHGKKA